MNIRYIYNYASKSPYYFRTALKPGRVIQVDRVTFCTGLKIIQIAILDVTRIGKLWNMLRNCVNKALHKQIDIPMDW